MGPYPQGRFRCQAHNFRRSDGILEYEGGVSNPAGLDLEELVAHRKESGSILGFPGATDIENSRDGLELECDILVPAAIEKQITGRNAPRIQAKIIAEAANGPTTFDADEILRQRGIMVLPDAFLNAGGVTVSYFEWINTLSHVRFGRMQKRFQERRGRPTYGVVHQRHRQDHLVLPGHGSLSLAVESPNCKPFTILVVDLAVYPGPIRPHSARQTHHHIAWRLTDPLSRHESDFA